MNLHLKMNLREFFDRYTDMLYIFKDTNKTKAESAAVL